jgi:hypothetical protein
MSIAGSADIFQLEMLELMSNMEFIWTYLDNLLTINHLDKMKKVLTRLLLEAGLKVNAKKSKFCAHEMGYL